ncbi:MULTISPECIES: hypothetical protein [unclassified Flagellimonas]|nr:MULTISPECIES: hypothetical protein [unclassified Flagellimonas]
MSNQKKNEMPSPNPEIWWLLPESNKTVPLINIVNANYAYWSK